LSPRGLDGRSGKGGKREKGFDFVRVRRPRVGMKGYKIQSCQAAKTRPARKGRGWIRYALAKRGTERRNKDEKHLCLEGEEIEYWGLGGRARGGDEKRARRAGAGHSPRRSITLSFPKMSRRVGKKGQEKKVSTVCRV